MTYDYVIVGPGSAGAALAARFSEKPRIRVLLPEAGPDYASLMGFKPVERLQKMERTFPALFGTDSAAAMGFKADPDIDSIIKEYFASEGIKLS